MLKLLYLRKQIVEYVVVKTSSDSTCEILLDILLLLQLLLLIFVMA